MNKKQNTPEVNYTVVLDELPPELTAETLTPKIHQQNHQGNYINQKNGQPLLQVYDKQTHGSIEDCCISLWTTPLQIYTKLDPHSRQVNNTLKKYINNSKVALSHHDGTKDENAHTMETTYT